MIQTNYNPDVLTCLANLSNDEVFTPPNLVNDILDLLPQELWCNPDAKFLDPVCKSGVFLREIAKRLMLGLEQIIPDKQQRINHIFKNQLYGIAITELTSLLSRRSVYCSKTANHEKYALCTEFTDAQGNIRYERMQHTWTNTERSRSEGQKCAFCGASRQVYDRDDALETYAYNFIHYDFPDVERSRNDRSQNARNQSPIQKIFNMKFDVIVGNPPYQLNDGGGSNSISAKPVYHKFIEQAKKLNPKYLTMIIPARWYAGGKGLNEFRNEMLNDTRISKIVDFPKSRECFPGVDIAGGVMYFLWENSYNGMCEITSITGEIVNSIKRKLNEFEIFVRDNIGIEILRKILSFNEDMLSKKVLTRNSFGFTSSDRGAKDPFENCVSLFSSSGITFVSKERVIKNLELLQFFKLSVGTLNPDRGGVNNAKDGKMNVTTKVRILNPNEVVTETYIVVDYYRNKEEAENCAIYLKSKFARFLVSLTLSSMHIVRENYQFVPIQDFSEPWTDEKLYKKYGLTEDEITFIDSMIRPMDLSQNAEVDE